MDTVPGYPPTPILLGQAPILCACPHPQGIDITVPKASSPQNSPPLNAHWQLPDTPSKPETPSLRIHHSHSQGPPKYWGPKFSLLKLILL